MTLLCGQASLAALRRAGGNHPVPAMRLAQTPTIPGRVNSAETRKVGFDKSWPIIAALDHVQSLPSCKRSFGKLD